MERLKKVLKVKVLLVAFTLIALPVYAMNSSDISTMSRSDIKKYYHQFFDLSSQQKVELSERGYSDEEISGIDKEDFIKLEMTWKLTDEQVSSIKLIHPELKYMDISNWTISDFEEYSVDQTEKIYAPSFEQVTKLKEKGISTELARQMLKEYQDYDTLLKQEDITIKTLSTTILEKQKEFNDYTDYKKSIKNKFKDILNRGE